MIELVKNYGYLGAFIVSLLGNATIFIPIPFALVIYICGSFLNPLILGLVTGTASTIGELTSYILGIGGRKVIEAKYGHRLDSVGKLIGRYGMLVIFLFALLPLPDDLLLIPLGMIKYDLRKLITAMFLGKTIMCLVIAYAGFFSFSSIKGVFETGGTFSDIASVVLLVLVIIAILRVDWEDLADRAQGLGEK
jgi:membrane protein YqaA with SNARE-associated domain